ncbi:MAG: hypothetical protein CMO80_18545 [Verrucomicrobiales bacterium]|nr:hypothetical protein [Verrucomicrobiales bacterium]|tara:strand:- start:23812 stop:24414 length:603 start_codon:yes stop_codon:yes gene_type:complete
MRSRRPNAGLVDEEQEYLQTPEPVPVPERFWSFETDGPFERCLVCHRSFRDEPVPYLIEKAYERDEVVLELAVCAICQTEMMREFSEASLKLMQHFIGEHVDVEAQMRQFSEQFAGDVEPWVSKCLIRRSPVDPKAGYRVAARCVGEVLDTRFPPNAISVAALEDMMKILSPQTKGFLNDFTEKYFGVPTGNDVPTILPV